MPKVSRFRNFPDCLTLMALWAITFFAFFPSLHNNFTDWDDRVHVFDNPYVPLTGIHDVFNILTSTVNHTYVPMATLSHAVEYSLFGFNPFLFHLNNLLLHMAVLALVFWFLRCLKFSTLTAGLTAFIFAIHPMRVESVAWVSERKDVLYGLFYMASLICYLKYRRQSNFKLYFVSLFLGLLSIMSKPMALTLPGALLLCDWYQKRRWSPSLLWDKIPYLCYIVPLTWITFSKVAVIYSLRPEILTSALTGVWTFAFYLCKFLWPVSLTPVYYLPQPIALLEGVYLKALFVVIGFCLLCVWFRKSRAFLFAAGFYLLSAPFIIRFNTVAYNRDIIAADRFIYLGSVGLCLVLGYGMTKLYQVYQEKRSLWKNTVGILVGVWLGGLIVLTSNQCEIWKDNQSIMTAVIRHYPDADFAYNNRAIANMREGKLNLALADFSQAIKLNPQRLRYFNNRGNLYSMMGQFELAIEDLNKVIAHEPDHFMAYYNRGTIYSEMGEYDLAVDDFDEALKIKPNYYAAYHNRLLAVNKR